MHHHHHHHIRFMELGHLLTRSGLTYLEVSSKVYHDSFCQLDSSVSLPWEVYFEAFYLHVVSSFSCVPVICPKLVLFLTPLQFVYLFCNLSQAYPAVLLTYFISAAVILLASLALVVQVSPPNNKTGRTSVLWEIVSSISEERRSYIFMLNVISYVSHLGNIITHFYCYFNVASLMFNQCAGKESSFIILKR